MIYALSFCEAIFSLNTQKLKQERAKSKNKAAPYLKVIETDGLSSLFIIIIFTFCL